MTLLTHYDLVRDRLLSGATQMEVAAELGVTQGRVSQMLALINSGKLDLSPEDAKCRLLSEPLHAPRAAEVALLDSDHFEWYRNITYHATNLQRGKKLAFTLLPSDIFPVPNTCPITGLPLSVKLVRTGKPSETGVSAHHIRVDPSIGYAPGNIIVVHRRVANIYKGTTLMDVARTSAALLKLARNA